MSRNKDIQDNKFQVLLSPRKERVTNKKINKQPRKKTWVHRIIQWRLIGYIVIGVSLWKLHQLLQTPNLAGEVLAQWRPHPVSKCWCQSQLLPEVSPEQDQVL